MALIFAATLGARNAEWLAWTRACPNRSVVGPTCKPQGMAPSADPGEKVALCVASKVIWFYFQNTAFVHIARCNQAPGYQVSQPLGGVFVYLVVVGGHGGVMANRLVNPTSFHSAAYRQRYLAVVALAVASSALHLASKFDLFAQNGTDQTRR